MRSSSGIIGSGNRDFIFKDYVTPTNSLSLNPFNVGGAAGNLMIVCCTHIRDGNRDTAGMFNDPAGWIRFMSWSQLYQVSFLTRTRAVGLYAKLLTPADNANIQFLVGSNNPQPQLRGFIFETGAGNFSISQEQSQATSGNPSAQNKTLVGKSNPTMAIGCAFASGQTPQLSLNPTATQDITNLSMSDSGNASFALREYNVSPANVAVDMPDRGGNNVLTSAVLDAV